MRLITLLFITLTLTTTLVAAQDSFCVKYSKALYGTSTRLTNYKLLQAIVARTIIGCNNDVTQAYGVPGVNGTDFDAFKASTCGNATVTGISKVPGLVEDPLNAPFFTGNVPKYTSLSNGFALNQFAGVNQTGFPGIRFVSVSGHDVTPYAASLGGKLASSDTKPTEGLTTHLIAFFGKAFGCDYDPNTDTNSNVTGGSAYIGKYNGATDMTAVHKDMNITQAVWNEFISTFNLTLRSFGASQDDINSMVVPVVAAFLRGPAGVTTTICNQPDCVCAPMYTNVGGACVVPSSSSGSSSSSSSSSSSTGTGKGTGTGGAAVVGVGMTPFMMLLLCGLMNLFV